VLASLNNILSAIGPVTAQVDYRTGSGSDKTIKITVAEWINHFCVKLS